MSTITGFPVSPSEAEFYETIDSTDAESLMQAMSEDDARGGVRPRAVINDMITLYHPDAANPSSCYVVPKNPKDRRVALMNLMAKTKIVAGKLVQWNNPRPMVEPQLLPLRCFVTGCQRAGGFRTRSDLIAHVNGKHEREAPMYKAVMERLMEQVVRDIPAEQFASLGLDAPDEQIFRCDGCPRFFDSEQGLKIHKSKEQHG